MAQWDWLENSNASRVSGNIPVVLAVHHDLRRLTLSVMLHPRSHPHLKLCAVATIDAVVRDMGCHPFAQSCWTGTGLLFTGASFATGVMVARLMAKSAARMRYVIGILHLSSGGMSGFTSHMGICCGCDNPDFVDWIYALHAEMG
jgi:hypothetical protein